MKCDEVQPLQGAYLDSELDARTTLEIEQHLKSCPECARRFDEEASLEVRLRVGLNRGQRTVTLWEDIERSVVTAAHRPQPSARHPQPAAWSSLLWALSEELQAGWRRARWAWSGLAAAWAVILALNFTANEPKLPLAAGHRMPSASELRFAVKQKQLLLAELAFTSDSTPADKPRAVPPSPRSDRRNETLNT